MFGSPVASTTVLAAVDEDGNAVASGSSVSKGTVLTLRLADPPVGTEWQLRRTSGPGTWVDEPSRSCVNTREGAATFQYDTAAGGVGEVSFEAGHSEGEFVPVQITPAFTVTVTQDQAPTAQPTAGGNGGATQSPTAAPTPSPAVPSTPAPSHGSGAYDVCKDVTSLSVAFTFCWSVREEAWLDVQLSAAIEDAWVGWAVPTDGFEMDGADAVVGWAQSVERFKMDRRDVGPPLAAAAQDLENEEIEHTSEGTTLRFSRRLAGTHGGMAIAADGQMQDLIIAVGEGSTIRRHTHENRAGLSVDLQSGELREHEESSALLVLHGLCMGVAWLFCTPAAVLVSVFRARVGSWMRAHMWLNITAVVLNVLGFVFIVADEGGEVEAGEGPHQALGLLILIGAILNAAYGLLRPSKPAAKEEKTRARAAFEVLHRAGGYLLLLLAWVNVWLGLSFPWVENGRAARALVPVVAAAFAGAVGAVKVREHSRGADQYRDRLKDHDDLDAQRYGPPVRDHDELDDARYGPAFAEALALPSAEL